MDKGVINTQRMMTSNQAMLKGVNPSYGMVAPARGADASSRSTASLSGARPGKTNSPLRLRHEGPLSLWDRGVMGELARPDYAGMGADFCRPDDSVERPCHPHP